MLSILVCQRCRNQRGIGWCAWDSINWEVYGCVSCDIGKDFAPISIKKEPPKNCLFELEHIVDSQEPTV